MKKYKISIIILSIVLLISLILNIYFISNSYINNKKYTTITYTSITTRNDYIYLNLKVETNQTYTFENTSFAIIINDTPIQAKGIVAGTIGSSILIDNSLTIKEDQTIIISFSYTLTEYPSPEFLFEGQKLELGKTITL